MEFLNGYQDLREQDLLLSFEGPHQLKGFVKAFRFGGTLKLGR